MQSISAKHQNNDNAEQTQKDRVDRTGRGRHSARTPQISGKRVALFYKSTSEAVEPPYIRLAYSDHSLVLAAFTANKRRRIKVSFEPFESFLSVRRVFYVVQALDIADNAAFSYAKLGSAKIFHVSFSEKEHGEAAGTIRTDGKGSLEVACANGWIAIHELQVAGKRRMATRDLLLGFRNIEDYTM